MYGQVFLKVEILAIKSYIVLQFLLVLLLE